MKKSMFFFLSLAFVIGCLGLAKEAQATSVDLTTGGSGFVDGAFFQWTDLNHSAVGTGVIDPFVRIQANGTEQGYNTDGRPVPFDEKTNANDTHSLLLSAVPVVNLSGINYREFLLDIAEPGGDTTFISLDQLKLWLADDPDINTTDLGFFGTPLFDLDGSEDSSVTLRGDLNPGNGKGDMFLYVPDALFDKQGPQYLYFYSQFGDSDASFEEWAICHQEGGCLGGGTPPNGVIPEPSSLGLLGIGLLGFWKRKKTVC